MGKALHPWDRHDLPFTRVLSAGRSIVHSLSTACSTRISRDWTNHHRRSPTGMSARCSRGERAGGGSSRWPTFLVVPPVAAHALVVPGAQPDGGGPLPVAA